jgi:hypothetical protein
MARPTRDEKRARRVTRLLTPLTTRREFLAGAAVAGVGVVTPVELVAQARDVRDYKDALFLTYYVMWAATLGGDGNPPNITGHPRNLGNPVDILNEENGHPKTVTVGSQGIPVYTREGPNQAEPPLARHWAIWRLARNFDVHFSDWSSQIDYVLLNAARVGATARGLAESGEINTGVLRQAFNMVKNSPTRISEPAQVAERNLEIWCE